MILSLNCTLQTTNILYVDITVVKLVKKYVEQNKGQKSDCFSNTIMQIIIYQIFHKTKCKQVEYL